MRMKFLNVIVAMIVNVGDNMEILDDMLSMCMFCYHSKRDENDEIYCDLNECDYDDYRDSYSYYE